MGPLSEGLGLLASESGIGPAGTFPGSARSDGKLLEPFQTLDHQELGEGGRREGGRERKREEGERREISLALNGYSKLHSPTQFTSDENLFWPEAMLGTEFLECLAYVGFIPVHCSCVCSMWHSKEGRR